MIEATNDKNNSTSSNENVGKDFVAIDNKRNRICVSAIRDNFTAIKIHGKWRKGYPEFDDLMDYYSELSDISEVEKYSLEARDAIQTLSNKD